MRYLPLLFAALLPLFPVPRVAAAEIVPPDVLNRIRAATVLVSVVYGEGSYAEVTSGSGMIVAPGVVLTNAHIVNEKAPARIYVHNEFLPRTPAAAAALRYDANEFVAADVVRHIASALIARAGIADVDLSRRQTNFDLALLTFTPPPGAEPPGVVFSLRAAPGDSVVASGYPDRGDGRLASFAGNSAFGPAASLVPGSVTRIINREPRLVVHDAPCGHGNSGGPLANARGEVVGMQTWTSVRGGADGVMSMAAGSRDLVAFLRAHGVNPAVSGEEEGSPGPAVPEETRDSFAFVTALAGGGDANFQALAGLLHHLGDCGFPRDDALAVRYLEEALRTAPAGPLLYLYQAGLAAVLFRSPQFHAPDYAESLLRAANNSDIVDSGSVHPDLKLLAYEASLNMQGLAAGVRYDPERALRLAEKAMAGGFALPYALLGYLYYFGDSSAGRDHATALRFAREAARNGIPEGISLLAHLYCHSDAVAADAEHFAIARRLAEEAASMGDAWALGLLANMLYDREQDVLRRH